MNKDFFPEEHCRAIRKYVKELRNSPSGIRWEQRINEIDFPPIHDSDDELAVVSDYLVKVLQKLGIYDLPSSFFEWGDHEKQKKEELVVGVCIESKWEHYLKNRTRLLRDGCKELLGKIRDRQDDIIYLKGISVPIQETRSVSSQKPTEISVKIICKFKISTC